ncbi:MAG: SocA family protein, partial [Bacteroidales bacterium]|nr:SocA family protein [Bacteroidales bacterium]
TDFYAYKTYGMAITGLSYKAIQFGPIPNNYKKIYAFVDEIDEMPVSFGNVEGDKLVSTIQPDMSVFSEKELNVLNQVATKFGNMTSKEMSEISHNEDAWKNNVGNFGAIDFSYAFSLKAI